MMESISDVDSNQQINIIVQLLEDDDSFSSIRNPSISIQTTVRKEQCHFNLKKSLAILFGIAYIVFLYYSFQILFFEKIIWKNNIWLWSFIITLQDLISAVTIIAYIYRPARYLKFMISTLAVAGALLLVWGIYELFHELTANPTIHFMLFCILVLGNTAFYSSCITWLTISSLS